MKTGIAELPLHPGRAPSWLFGRMIKIARPISQIIIDEYGTHEYLRRLSDPFFFQSFGCVLGFDWHSSGLTTTVTGALKMALKQEDGILVAGGKGKTSKKAPEDIVGIGERFNLKTELINKLVYTSRVSAKVDNSLIQDSYQLYHHSFFIDEKGKWAVVQQGLNPGSRLARRYHWLDEKALSYIEEPHSAIVSEKMHKSVLNLASKENKKLRQSSLDLVKENPSRFKRQTSLYDFKALKMPTRHEIHKIDLGNFKALESAYEIQPKNFEEMMMIKGMGAKTLRALALISNLVYGTDIDWKDPAKFSFAHGGKDGIPFPVDKELYDKNTALLMNAVKDARIGDKDKLSAIKRLSRAI